MRQRQECDVSRTKKDAMGQIFRELDITPAQLDTDDFEEPYIPFRLRRYRTPLRPAHNRINRGRR